MSDHNTQGYIPPPDVALPPNPVKTAPTAYPPPPPMQAYQPVAQPVHQPAYNYQPVPQVAGGYQP